MTVTDNRATVSTVVTIESDTLLALINGCKVATSDDKTLPVFTGIGLELSHGELIGFATDRYRLAVGTIALPDYSGDDFRVILSPESIRNLTLVLKANAGGSVELQFHGNGVKVTTLTGIVELSDSGIDMPKWRSLLTNSYDGVNVPIRFNAQFLADIYKIAGKVRNGYGKGLAPNHVDLNFNGASRAAVATFTDRYAVQWQYLLMPVRIP